MHSLMFLTGFVKVKFHAIFSYETNDTSYRQYKITIVAYNYLYNELDI
jgi:hypothetical protein